MFWNWFDEKSTSIPSLLNELETANEKMKKTIYRTKILNQKIKKLRKELRETREKLERMTSKKII